LSETSENEQREDEEPTGEEREQIAQEGRIQQTEEEESQEGV
jgi:hypothetical protein